MVLSVEAATGIASTTVLFLYGIDRTAREEHVHVGYRCRVNIDIRVYGVTPSSQFHIAVTDRRAIHNDLRVHHTCQYMNKRGKRNAQIRGNICGP